MSPTDIFMTQSSTSPHPRSILQDILHQFYALLSSSSDVVMACVGERQTIASHVIASLSFVTTSFLGYAGRIMMHYVC